MCITRETDKHLLGVTSKASNLAVVVVMVWMVVRQLAGQHPQMVFATPWYGGGGGGGTSLNSA